MNITIQPSLGYGTVCAPPSKSITHRALLCGALSKGCCIENVAFSQDIESTIRCLEGLGAQVERGKNSVNIRGLDPFTCTPNCVLDCGESGSTLRFLLPLCLLSDQSITLQGSKRLLERPMIVYENLCREHGFEYVQDPHSITVRGRLQAGEYRLPGNVSSQFITGLLFALSMLDGASRISIDGPLQSAPYVDLTIAVLKGFGVCIEREGNTFFIPGGACYRCEQYEVEGDYSNGAYLDALNILGGDVKVTDFTDVNPQGDKVYQEFFDLLKRGHRQFDLRDCPDLGPLLFAVAAALDGADFTGTARLRFKESDRCASMALELARFGIQTLVGEDSFSVLPGELHPPLEPLQGHNDHRVVMALAILCTVTGGTIVGAEAVAKSFPDFFEKLQQLGICLTEQ